jgi:hypothetical protein
MLMFDSAASGVGERCRNIADGRYVVTYHARKPKRLTHNRVVADMLSSMRRGDVDSVIDVLRALGVDIVLLH